LSHARPKQKPVSGRIDREFELQQIEELLGEDFTSLRQARIALREETEKSQDKMWRVTVAAPYFIRRHTKTKKRRRRQLSPASAAYMVTGWFRTRADAQKNTPKLVRRAIAGRTRAVKANKNAYDPGIPPDVETKQVPYRAGFIGRIEKVDER
jgi:DNA primase